MALWLRLEPGGTDGGLLFSMVDRQAEVGLEVTLQGGLQQMHVSVYGAAEGGALFPRLAYIFTSPHLPGIRAQPFLFLIE